ncbi:MAG: winged helix-turn-helix transcriptional regulator [Pseudomonadota bacterium]
MSRWNANGPGDIGERITREKDCARRAIEAPSVRARWRLSRTGRTSRGSAELGRQIGLSAPSVAERVRRLEEAGVIEGYSARI